MTAISFVGRGNWATKKISQALYDSVKLYQIILHRLHIIATD